ncbi:MAG: R3H domain-containing nucleic acid-binding protein [Leptolyngbyaceae cyanobacterium bins.349]|nr:R3H domain-containing nucleic acid-binding protein [Leptolyngbyaceae cyanobacterium bins.349]
MDTEREDTEREQRGQQWLQEFLNLSGIETKVLTQESPVFWEDTCWLVIDDSTLSDEQVTQLLGENGHVLDSIQYLANTTLNLGAAPEQQGAFTVDLAGYRERRYQELKAIAENAAVQARETAKEVELKSLSAAERRQVHTILKEHTDLETYSRGQEPDRRLVVRLLED